MGKKLLYALPVILIVGLLFLPDIMWFTAKKAFEEKNHDKPWAPKAAFRSGEFFMRALRYERAIAVFKRCQKTWPDSKWHARCQYRIALCYANDGQSEKAIEEYDKFLKQYPNHDLAEMARKGRTQAEANR